MTERTENVEPPLASRRVQITVAVLASVALVWLLRTTWRHASSAPVQTVVEQMDGGWGETLLLRIDLNIAEPRELALLPGVGPILATRIAQDRIRVGPFTSVDDLSRVYGIGPKKLDQIREICVVDSVSATISSDPRLASARDVAAAAQQDCFDAAGR